MRTPAEYEAEIDRLAAARDFEANIRASMAEAAYHALEDLKAAEEKLKARDEFLRNLQFELKEGTACDETVWLDDHTTVVDAITALLDDPKARGEQALPLDMA